MIEFAKSSKHALEADGDIYYHEYVNSTESIPRIEKIHRMSVDSELCARMCLYAYGCPKAYLCPVGQVNVTVVSALSDTEITNVLEPDTFAILGHTKTLTDSFLIYVRNFHSNVSYSPIAKNIYICKRLILLVHDDELYRDGHYILIWPPEQHSDVWYVRDPLRADGLALMISEEQLLLLLRGATCILH